MTAKITFFPVGCGDMTLVRLPSGRNILIDLNIRAAADDPEKPERDVASDLRQRLRKDSKGRRYVDAFVLSHPDKDHCSGLENHFHLGSPEDCPSDKLLINEIWSSPIVFRRANSSNHTLCPDAKAFNAEAKRRVQCYRDSGLDVGAGDRIRILGRDQNGKTDGLDEILVEIDEKFSEIDRNADSGFQATLLGPLPFSDDEDEEDMLAKNDSSVILHIAIKAGERTFKFLTGGDAEVQIWERLWERHSEDTESLDYDVLLAPHHCSWHSLSHDSWSEFGDEAEVSKKARKALGRCLEFGYIVASSSAIVDDDNDPPCIRAKREYEKILRSAQGTFLCTGSHPDDESMEPLDLLLEAEGIVVAGSGSRGIFTKSPNPRAVDKRGGNRFA